MSAKSPQYPMIGPGNTGTMQPMNPISCRIPARMDSAIVMRTSAQYIFSYSPFWTFLRQLKPARLAR